MFPFHRKHNSSPGHSKQPGKRRTAIRNEDAMTEEEYLEYIHNHDTSRNQSTSEAHNRYCNTILREKEEILLSGISSEELNQDEGSYSTINGEFNYLLPQHQQMDIGSTSSLPSSPTEQRTFILDSRRKSDSSALLTTGGSSNSTMMDVMEMQVNDPNNASVALQSGNSQNDYILTLKIDDTESDNRNSSKILLYRIVPPNNLNGVAATISGSDDDPTKYVFIDATLMDGDVEDIDVANKVEPVTNMTDHNYTKNGNDHPEEQVNHLVDVDAEPEVTYVNIIEEIPPEKVVAEVSTPSVEPPKTAATKTKKSDVRAAAKTAKVAKKAQPHASSSEVSASNDKGGKAIKNVAIDVKTSIELKKLLIGDPTKRFSHHWLEQNFTFNSNVNKWQLVQLKKGCCGVVASVQASIIKALLFDPGYSKSREPLRPTRIELLDSLINSLSSILWKAGEYQRAVLITPPSTRKIPRDKSDESSGYTYDGITDTFTYVTYRDYYNLRDAIMRNLKVFTSPPNHGYLYFLVCVILTRGIGRIMEDMNDENNRRPLIMENGYCSIELVMLLITGQAISTVYQTNNSANQNPLLKGIAKRSEIGFLSSLEHTHEQKVVGFLKNPEFPIWLVRDCSNHLTILYSSKKENALQDIRQPFLLHHYDSLTCYENCTELNIVVDPTGDRVVKTNSREMIPDLQMCIKTKWNKGTVAYGDNTELFKV